MNKLLPILAAGLGLTSAAQADDWCKHSADRSASIDMSGATRIVICTGAGDLKVRGETGRRKTVRNYGNAGPTKLWAVEQLIDKLLLEAKWDQPMREPR